MAKRRNSELELCFDSMTDLITNLAGGLILLVLLLLGVTREAPGQPPDKAAADKVKAGPRPILDLEKRANNLTLAIKLADAELAAMEARMPKIRKEVDDLLGKVGSLAPTKKDAAEEKKGVKTVTFRLPLEQRVPKGGILFYVEDRRVIYPDIPALVQARDKRVAKAKADKEKVENPLTIDLPGAPFKAQFDERPDGSLILTLTRRNPAEKGETLAEIKERGSRFLAALAKHSPQTHAVQLHVYPDSFEQLHEVRKAAWDADYDVGWTPYKPGEDKRLKFGFGGAVID